MSCWVKVNESIIQDDAYYPCGADPVGGAATCCDRGSICLSNGFCGYTGYLSNASYANTAGYFLGGCTDAEFSKPGCRDECSQWQNSNAVWDYDNTGTNTWTCCGDVNGFPDCKPPQGPNFSGADSPDPFSLKAYASISSIGTSLTAVPFGTGSATTPTATATAIATVTTSAEIGNSPSDSAMVKQPSGNTVAAIVIGVILGLSWVIGGIVYLFISMRRKQGRRQQQSSTSSVAELSLHEKAFGSGTITVTGPHQLMGTERTELPTPSWELDAQHVGR